jgi:hypothetical protein
MDIDKELRWKETKSHRNQGQGHAALKVLCCSSLLDMEDCFPAAYTANPPHPLDAGMRVVCGRRNKTESHITSESLDSPWPGQSGVAELAPLRFWIGDSRI